MNSDIPSVTLITCHYGDPWWVCNLIRQVHNLDFIKKIFIFDNSTNSNLTEIAFDSRVKVLNCPTEYSANLQHAFTLNWALRNLEIESEWILILDSDIVFLDHKWVNFFAENTKDYDALLTLQEGSNSLTHPCFNLIHRNQINNLDYMEGMESANFDTGRLIGLQLGSRHVSVLRLSPTRWFKNSFGYVYCDSSILHVTSASVRFMPSRSNVKLKRLKSLYSRWISLDHSRSLRTMPLGITLIIFMFYLSFSFFKFKFVGLEKHNVNLFE